MLSEHSMLKFSEGGACMAALHTADHYAQAPFTDVVLSVQNCPLTLMRLTSLGSYLGLSTITFPPSLTMSQAEPPKDLSLLYPQ